MVTLFTLIIKMTELANKLILIAIGVNVNKAVNGNLELIFFKFKKIKIFKL